MMSWMVLLGVILQSCSRCLQGRYNLMFTDVSLKRHVYSWTWLGYPSGRWTSVHGLDRHCKLCARYGDPRKDSTAEDSGRRMDWILWHTYVFSAVDWYKYKRAQVRNWGLNLDRQAIWLRQWVDQFYNNSTSQHMRSASIGTSPNPPNCANIDSDGSDIMLQPCSDMPLARI